jgi:hypothetical protein
VLNAPLKNIHNFVDGVEQVNGYTADQLDHALEGSKVIVVPAGVPRKVCLLTVTRFGQRLTPYSARNDARRSFQRTSEQNLSFSFVLTL